MTTLTINENINLKTNNFATYEDLVNFILFDNLSLEIEELSYEESKFINSLNSFQELKNIANLV
jgi:hypothetical protein